MTHSVGYVESPYERLVKVVWGGGPMAAIILNVYHNSYDVFSTLSDNQSIASFGLPYDGTWKHLDMYDYCVQQSGFTEGDVLRAAFDETNFEIIDIQQMSSTVTGFDPTHSGQSETAYEVANLTAVDGYRGYMALAFIPPAGQHFPDGIGAWTAWDYAANGINPVGPWVIWGNHITNHHETVYSEKILWILDFSKWQTGYKDYAPGFPDLNVSLPQGKFVIRRWIPNEHSDLDPIASGTDTFELKIFPTGTVFTITDASYTASKSPTFTGTRTCDSFGIEETLFTFDKTGFL